MPLVVDASVTLSWCFRDEQSQYAARVLRQLTSDTALVPALWALEVANGLLSAERRGRVSGADIAGVREILADLPITLDVPSLDGALGPVFDLARARGLSEYDAAYLELAMREGLPLATQDESLRRAAFEVGAQIIR